jgi:uncharacterized protein YbjT (DUF2867 family)
MKILILGATGRTGKWLVREALSAGHKINILVRNAESLTEFGVNDLQIFTGIPADINVLEKAMAGCEAVISALNVSRNSDFPWAALRTPKDFLSETIAHLITLCNKLKINRILIVSAWGVGDSRPEIPGWFGWLIDKSNIGYAYADHYAQEELLKASNLNYTIVRPVGLTNSQNDKEIRVSINGSPRPSLTISRKSVAKFMIGILENGYSRQTVTIST